MTIDLAPDLRLPEAVVSDSFALLGMKGAGKSNAAVVFAEQLFHAGIPFTTIDPKGDWWGIRGGAGGKGKGLPIPIFGGLHADVPIDPQAGRLFADLIVGEHLTALIDTSELTKGEGIRFLTAFFDQLFRLKNRATYPMHLFLEEADEYVPQKVYREVADLVRKVELVVKRGRQRGLGITVATQRAASVNKDVLTQTDTLIVLRNTSPQDRKAVLAWIDYNASAKGIVDELPSLDAGEAWVSSPAKLRILQKVRFHQRTTFDSGATPELGEKVKPATLADIDVKAITAAVGDLVERAKADDPKALRARIAQLEREVDGRSISQAPPERVEVPVEVPFVPDSVERALKGALKAYDKAIAAAEEARVAVTAALQDAQRVQEGTIATGRPKATENRAAGKGAQPTRPPAPARNSAGESPRADVKIGEREWKILAALGAHRLPDGPPKQKNRKLALLTGYSAKASTIGAGLSELRKAGYVNGWEITGSGEAALAANVGLTTLPTGPALLDYWNGQLGERERTLLRELLSAYPQPLTNAEMADRTGYSATASTIGAGMSTLRGLGIVEGWKLSDEFADSIELAA